MIEVQRCPHLVVCYDDTPSRYTELARLCAAVGWVMVTVEHPEALSQILDNQIVIAVLLDHDLRNVDGEPCTGVQVASECLIHRSVPVVVSSANHAGASAIANLLSEHGVPHRVISVLETAPEERWFGALALFATRIADRHLPMAIDPKRG